jgi:hypothetical protein
MIWLRFMALIAASLLASCIDGREELWLEANGSGHAEVSYSLPSSVAKLQGGENGIRELIRDFLAKTPALKSAEYEVKTERDRLNIRVRASFDSAMDLKKISSSGSTDKLPASVSHLLGKVAIETQGQTVNLTRTISPGNALPGSIFMPASKFAGHRLVYIIHLPVTAAESNATRIEDGGRTLVWDFPLAEAIKGPVSTRFKAQIPIPVSLIAAAAGFFVIIGALLFFGWRKVRQSRARTIC